MGDNLVIGKQKEIPFINYLKGVAIILVVLGHSISGMMNSITNSPKALIYLHDFVESFQMPFFFVISGFLFSYSNKNKNFVYWDNLKSKLITLGIPYIVGTLIYCIVGMTTHDDKYTLVGFINCWHQPVSHFWFLYVQIFIYILVPILGYNNKNLRYVVTILLILRIGYTFAPFKEYIEAVYPLSRILYYSIFFCVGELIELNDLYFKFEKHFKLLLPISALSFLVIFIAAERLNAVLDLFFQIGLSITGTILFTIICLVFYSFFGRNFVLTCLGKNTMPIYLYHSLFVSFIRKVIIILIGENVFVITIISTLFGIVIPYLLVVLANRIPLLNILFYPKRVKTSQK